MKRIVSLLLAFCAISLSCNKTVRVPVSYSVETETGKDPQDVYMSVTGTKYVALTVKFLTGASTDSVTLEVMGLPKGITVTPQKATGLPTYYYKYVYTTKDMPVGSYPVSIVATAPGTAPKTYNFNLIVRPNDCASFFMGGMTGSNACSARNYTYNATGNATGTTNLISINNLGGYGLNTDVNVTLNCLTDSLYIPTQNIGNGVVMQGMGTFTTNQMIIYYTATAPGEATETCTATLNR